MQRFSVRFFTLLVTLLGSTVAFGQIQFFEGTWEKAVESAAKAQKLIFVDAYTEWCGPCKAMAAYTFTDMGVGKYFNDNFINVQLDMEKGEGTTFARDYGVYAYPTLLFINPNNKEVVHKVLGFRDAAKLNGEAEMVVLKGKDLLKPANGKGKPAKTKKPKKVKKQKS